MRYDGSKASGSARNIRWHQELERVVFPFQKRCRHKWLGRSVEINVALSVPNWISSEGLTPPPGGFAGNLRGDTDSSQGAFRPQELENQLSGRVTDMAQEANEGWADFADDLRALASKTYPALQDEVR